MKFIEGFMLVMNSHDLGQITAMGVVLAVLVGVVLAVLGCGAFLITGWFVGKVVRIEENRK